MRLEGVNPATAAAPVERGSQRAKGEASGGELKQAGPQPMVQNEGQEDVQKDLQTVQKSIELLNRTMKNYNTELHFTLHEKSGEYLVKIINTKDNTVIREIPPQKVLDMVAYFKEVLGLIVDKFI